MAHFAKLDENNYVIAVHCVNNDALDSGNEEVSGIQFLSNLHNYNKWKQTSYNHNFRRRYAGVGFFYDEANDVFIEPQPYPSWTLNSNFDWQAPKNKPEGNNWFWNEELGDWVNA